MKAHHLPQLLCLKKNLLTYDFHLVDLNLMEKIKSMTDINQIPKNGRIGRYAKIVEKMTNKIHLSKFCKILQNMRI